MKNQGLCDLFIDQLRDVYSAERQIIKSLPKLIKLASLPALRDALSDHLKETEDQVKRIEKIFSILELNFSEKNCEAMQGIIKEAEELVKGKSKSSTLDAAIICAAQKVEHYEIATYGTLKSFAKHLDFDSQVVDLLESTLEEEKSADKTLTKIAEGSFFSSGINQEAANCVAAGKKSS